MVSGGMPDARKEDEIYNEISVFKEPKMITTQAQEEKWTPESDDDEREGEKDVYDVWDEMTGSELIEKADVLMPITIQKVIYAQ